MYFLNKLLKSGHGEACVAVSALDEAPMIKFSLQCTPNALCWCHGDQDDKYHDRFDDKYEDKNYGKYHDKYDNFYDHMTGIDGIHENRDDQFTADQVSSLGKSSQPYGARSLSKITNIDTAFYKY